MLRGGRSGLRSELGAEIVGFTGCFGALWGWALLALSTADFAPFRGVLPAKRARRPAIGLNGLNPHDLETPDPGAHLGKPTCLPLDRAEISDLQARTPNVNGLKR